MSGLLAERVYSGSPIWLQQTMIAAYGWWWHRRRFSRHFHRQVSELKAREYWTAAQFQHYQEMRLYRVLALAWRSSYYRQVFLEAGIAGNMHPLEILARLPLLSKETLRKRAKDLLIQSPVPKGTIVFKSSGTTGTPTDIFYTPEFHALEQALREARSFNWAGVSYQDRRVMFGVRKVCHFDQDQPPFWRFSPAEDMAYASIYHLSPRFLSDYIAFIRAYRPSIIMGYPSALNTVARYALENNDLPAPAKAVVTSSETVSPQAREAITAAWQCQIYDSYGAVEGCLHVSQCEHGRYHVSPEVGIIEIIDENGNPCPPGIIGEVVCTGLQNTLQPLIRYRIGDVACWSTEQNCQCGRGMSILESIEGRYEDICYTLDGRQMLRFDTVFKGVENIKEAQVVQEQLDLFAIRIVPANGFGEQEIEKIKNNMYLHIGGARTRVEVVPAIARAASGKFRAVICNLSAEEQQRLKKVSR